MPACVEIGPIRYRVTDDRAEYNAAAEQEGSRLWGKITYPRATIVVCPDQDDQHRRIALLHEVLHGVWHVNDINHDTDEDCIRALTATLLDTLRRNRGLVEYLLED